MKIWKITAEIATLDRCTEDNMSDIITNLLGDGVIVGTDIQEQKLIYGGEKPAKCLTRADAEKIVHITTPNLLKPKRKYTRRAKAKVVPGDIPAHERPPANQPNGTTVVQVHEDGTKTEHRK